MSDRAGVAIADWEERMGDARRSSLGWSVATAIVTGSTIYGVVYWAWLSGLNWGRGGHSSTLGYAIMVGGAAIIIGITAGAVVFGRRRGWKAEAVRLLVVDSVIAGVAGIVTGVIVAVVGVGLVLEIHMPVMMQFVMIALVPTAAGFGAAGLVFWGLRRRRVVNAGLSTRR